VPLLRGAVLPAPLDDPRAVGGVAARDAQHQALLRLMIRWKPSLAPPLVEPPSSSRARPPAIAVMEE
jgi:hypothetical protein